MLEVRLDFPDGRGSFWDTLRPARLPGYSAATWVSGAN